MSILKWVFFFYIIIWCTSCKKCTTCEGGCYSCLATRGPTAGQTDTLCSKDFKSFNEYYEIVLTGDSLACRGIPATHTTYSSCDPNLPGGAICPS